VISAAAAAAPHANAYKRASDTPSASFADDSAAVQILRDPLPVALDLGALTGVIGTRLVRTLAPQRAIKLMSMAA
jgi:hypothetical protein